MKKRGVRQQALGRLQSIERKFQSQSPEEFFVRLGEEGLTRLEARWLVAQGFLEKVRVVGPRKWADTNPPESFVYRLTGKREMT